MRRLVAVAMFFLAACGSASTVSAHTISLAYKSGDSYKYALSVVLKYNVGIASMGVSVPLEVDVSAKEAVKVNSVDSSGAADLSITLTNLTSKTSVNGTTTTTTTASKTVEVKVGADGHVISVNGDATGNSTLPGLSGTDSGFVSAILPDKPVKPGDTWSRSYDESNLAGTTSSIHVTADNKYLRDEKVGDTNTAVVESKTNANLNLTLDMSALGGSSLFPSGGGSSGIQGLSMKGTVTGDTTSWIDSGARRIVKSHSTGTVDATLTFTVPAGASPPPGLNGPITFKGTQTLDMTPA